MADTQNTDKLETSGLQPTVGKDKQVKKARAKKPNFFVRLFGRIKRWFKELISESKKVTWPSFKQVVNNTLVVLAVCVLVGAVIVVVDIVFRSGLELFVGLF